MKFFVAFILFTSTLFAQIQDSQKIPLQECLKAKYGHTLGGTLHSKSILAQKLINKVRKSLPLSDEKALIMIQEKHPHLAIKTTTLIIKNCKALYKGSSKDSSYFFHPETFSMLNNKGK